MSHLVLSLPWHPLLLALCYNSYLFSGLAYYGRTATVSELERPGIIYSFQLTCTHPALILNINIYVQTIDNQAPEIYLPYYYYITITITIITGTPFKGSYRPGTWQRWVLLI